MTRDTRQIGPWSICVGRSLKRALLIGLAVFVTLSIFFAVMSTTTALTGHPGFGSSNQSEPILVSTSAPIPETLTVEGTVLDIAQSARVIWLTEPVSGVSQIALVESTTILSPGGHPARLLDVKRGSRVRAMGKRGASDGIIADAIAILATPVASPSP